MSSFGTQRIAALIALCALGGTYFSVLPANGASEQFTVSQEIVSADSGPPTVPTNVIATPVATTQIDLSWDASSDDIGVSGYEVFRDGLFIATTSATVYQDTGLTPSTTYGYTLRAFDAVPNFSSSTPTTTATTLASTTPSATSTGGSAPRIELMEGPPEITDLLIETGRYSAKLSWRTSVPTQSIVRWGESGSFELGSLKSRAYSSIHGTTIESLTPDTIYEFQIEGIDTHGRMTSQYGKFRTKALPDVQPPLNVDDFTARIEGEDVVLTWQSPPDEDFSHVRLLRGSDFYPSDPYDGFVVYEDDGESHRDHGAAAGDGIVYYTAFAYDEDGNVSSGAVVHVVVGEAVPPDRTSSTTLTIDLSDITFIQNDVVLPIEEGSTVYIDGDEALTISIDYDLLPEHLKTILVTLEDPERTEYTFSFLLRINEAKTRYEAIIAPLMRSGMFDLSVDVFDLKRKEIATAEGMLVVTSTTSSSDGEERETGGLLGSIFSTSGFFLWLFLLVLLLIAYRLIARYRLTEGSTMPDLHQQSQGSRNL